MKILLADDEPDLLYQYRAVLEDLKHVVSTANDGESCVDVYSREYASNPEAPFDAVVLDYSMPKMNGLDAAKEILLYGDRKSVV